VGAIRKRFYRDPGSASTGVPVYVHGPHGRQCAGYVVSVGSKRLLRKTGVDRAKHYCRRHRGYGVELDALKQADRLGVQAIRLEFIDGTALEAPVELFAMQGIHDTLGGFGVQVFLPRKHWHDPSDPQGSLFGGGELT